MVASQRSPHTFPVVTMPPLPTAPTLASILRLASHGPAPECSAETFVALSSCNDLAALAELSRTHGMAPWLAGVVSREPRLAAEARFEPLRRAARNQALETLRLFAELVTILQILRDEHVRVIVLKGPAVAQTYYPDPSLRTYGDIDLLIHEADLALVSHLLLTRGYLDKYPDQVAHRLHDCHGIWQKIYVEPVSGRVIELHCDHLQIGLEPVSMDSVWLDALDTTFGGAPARVLEAHDLFVQLCVHLHRHGFERLMWFKDLDLMVRCGKLDWGLVRAKAAQQGCLNSVSYTLRLLGETLGTPLTGPAAALANAQPWLSRLSYGVVWQPRRIRNLEPQRALRFRRIVQFAPEASLLRGGLPSLLTTGRRVDKLRVLGAAVRRRLSSSG
jgi:Uncharacterised nucleotidyltransferase